MTDVGRQHEARVMTAADVADCGSAVIVEAIELFSKGACVASKETKAEPRWSQMQK